MILKIFSRFINLDVSQAFGFHVKSDPNSKLYFWADDYELDIKLPESFKFDSASSKYDVLVYFKDKLTSWLSDILELSEYKTAELERQIDYLVKNFKGIEKK